MRGYLVFTKKELLEQLRTYKLLIIICVFFLFGMMSPLTAKLLPDILSGVDMEGFEITMPTPTVYDSYSQFFQNITEMGILILLLVFGGTLSNELGKGTLINILAKGLPRHTVILSKYTAALLLWTAGYLLSAVTTYGYTVYLFEQAQVVNLVFSLFCLWLFGCFVLALIFLSSTLTSGNFGGLILSAVTLAILLMLGIFPKTDRYNPITLASKNLDLIKNVQDVQDLMLTVLITVILTVACLVLSIIFFRKKKL